MISSLPLIRYVLVREQITIIHGHSAFSTLAHETMMIGRLLDIQVKFNDKHTHTADTYYNVQKIFYF